METVSLSSRGVAQPGSAPAWGAGGRRFKSVRPDHSPNGLGIPDMLHHEFTIVDWFFLQIGLLLLKNHICYKIAFAVPFFGRYNILSGRACV